MSDQSASSGIVTSSDLFTAIETEVALTALSLVIVKPDEYAPGIPATAITAAQVREILHSRNTSEPISDAIWSALVRRTMTHPLPWQGIAIWAALPGLRAIVYRLNRVWRTDIEDLRSEVVLGFMEALRQADPDQSNLGPRLWWNTYRLARQTCRHVMFERATEHIDLIAAWRADDSRTSTSPARPVDPAVDQSDPVAVESARLGSMAARLGLRTVIDGRSSDGEAGRVIFLPRSQTAPTSTVVNTRGNGSGEAA